MKKGEGVLLGNLASSTSYSTPFLVHTLVVPLLVPVLVPLLEPSKINSSPAYFSFIAKLRGIRFHFGCMCLLPGFYRGGMCMQRVEQSKP